MIKEVWLAIYMFYKKKQVSAILIWVLAIVAFCTNAYAQPRCDIRHFSTADGLSDNRVICFFKDHDGFMWMGTQAGINKFDGHNFTVYKSRPGDQSPLKNNRIDFITEDADGYLWLKAYDKQVYRFDKRNGSFFSISKLVQPGLPETVNIDKIILLDKGRVALVTKNEGVCLLDKTSQEKPIYNWCTNKGNNKSLRLPSDSITTFYHDIKNKFWVATGQGLVCYYYSNGAFKQYPLPQNFASSIVTTITENTGQLFFGTSNGHLLSFNKATEKLTDIVVGKAGINGLCVSRKTPQLYITTQQGGLLSLNAMSLQLQVLGNYKAGGLLSVYEDKSGALWLEPEKDGVVLFETGSNNFSLFTQPNYSNYFHDASEYRVQEDNKGIVWVNMKGCGFGYFEPLAKTIQPFYNDPRQHNYQFSNMVNDELIDDAGVMWLCTDVGGIEKITFQPENFKNTKLVTGTFFRTENDVRGMYTDSRQRLWVATKGKKVFVGGDSNAVKKLFGNAFNLRGGVYVITEDAKHNIWLGTKGDGLYKAEPVNGNLEKYNIKHFVANAKDPFAISSNMVYALVEDKHGRIWAGTFGGGINLIEEATGATKFYHSSNQFKKYPTHACTKIRHLALDNLGKIWIGTTEGLLVFDAQNPNLFQSDFVHYTKTPGSKTSLGDDDIQFVYKDKTNTMWVLTSAGGLNEAKNVNAHISFQNYSMKDGLPSDYLLSCMDDGNGFLWLATQNGLARFDKATKRFRNFDAADGLPATGFAEASCTANNKGELIFGTLNGYLSFNPKHIADRKIASNIVFTNLQINSRDVVPGEEGAPLKYSLNDVNEIKLSYDQDVMSIDYTVLDYRFDEKSNYAYRLLGFDSNWYDNKTERRVTYTNLPPGKYIFQVRASSNDFYSNNPTKELSIIITPPLWKTWWAYGLYIIAGIVLLLVVRKYEMAMIKLRQRIIIEHMLTEHKLNFFTNVSHELRTPLTLIVAPIEEIAAGEKLSPQGNMQLNIIRKNAERLTRFVDQLLDLRKVQSGKSVLKLALVEVSPFIHKVAGYFAETSKQKQVALSFAEPKAPINLWLDADKMDVVIYNVLSNAFKFSPNGSNIHIGISEVEGKVLIEIADSGVGVPENELDKIFGLYFEGENKHAANLKGSGIGLALCREFVELHGGTIAAKNNAQGGLSIIVALKTGKAHFEKDKVTFGAASPNVVAVQNTETFEEEIETAQKTTNQHLPLLLLVEDNEDLRAFLKSLLAEKYTVAIAENGQQGLEMAAEILPDVILSDVMMPVMNGITMLDKLKNNPLTSHIPVVLLSAKFSVESQVEGLKYGADYYLGKPFQKELLLTALNNLVLQRKKIFDRMLTAPAKKTMEVEPTPLAITSYDEVFLQKVIAIVEEKMNDVDFNIEVVAEAMNMSRSPFYKKLKSLTDLSPVEFVKEIRLKKSLQYLDAGERNIASIAYEVGFNNPKYFSTCFKQRFGKTPSEYINAL